MWLQSTSPKQWCRINPNLTVMKFCVLQSVTSAPGQIPVGYNSDISMRLSDHLDPLATVQRTVTSDLPCQIPKAIMFPFLYDCSLLCLCIQDNILLFPWADFAILIPGIRHPYVKQVFQDESLAHRLFNTDCLLCFGVSVSAISCQMTSTQVHQSRRWSSRLLLEAHFVTTINGMFHAQQS